MILEHWDWHDITSSDEASDIKNLLEERWRHHPSYELTKISSYSLCFYPAYDLLRLTASHRSSGSRRQYFALYSSEKTDLRFLDWESQVIHEMNADQDLRLTDDTLIEYLYFFCYFIKGDDGPFCILGSLDEVNWETDPDDPDSIQWSDDVEPEARDLSKQISEPRPVDLEGCDDLGAAAELIYGDALFRAEFCVQPSGMVQMVEDHALAHELSVRRLRTEVDRGFTFLDVTKRKRYSKEDLGELRKLLMAGSSVSDIEVDASLVFRDPMTEGGEHAEAIEYTRPILITNAIIRGSVDLRAVKFDAPVQFDDCEIQGGILRFDETQFSSSLKIENTTITGGIVGTDARIGGRASFEGTSVQGEIQMGIEQLSERVSVSLTGMTVAGDLDLEEFIVEGALDLSDSRIQGNLLAGGISAGRRWRHANRTMLDISGAYVGGSVTIGHRWTKGISGKNRVILSSVNGSISLSKVRIEGDLNIQALQCWGWFNASGARISGNVDARPPIKYAYIDDVAVTWSGGNAERTLSGEPDHEEELDYLEKLAGMRATRTRCAADFSLYQSQIDGYVDISCMAIGGNAIVYFAKLGAFFSRASEIEPLPGWIAGDLMFGGSRIASVVRLEGLRVGGSVGCISLESAGFSLEVANSDDVMLQPLRSSVGGGVAFRSASINGRLAFRGLTLMEQPPQWAKINDDWKDYLGVLLLDDCIITADLNMDEASLSGCALIRDTRISGRLKARGLSVAGADVNSWRDIAEVDDTIRENWGSVNVDNCTVGGDVEFRCLTPTERITERDRPGHATHLATKVERHIDLSRNRVNGHLDLRNLVAGGAIDLNRTKLEGDLRLGALPIDETSSGRTSKSTTRRKADDCWSARCKSLNIERLECIGDVDLTGVVVTGAVSGRRCRIEGQLQILDQELWDQTGGVVGFGKASGLDLTAASVSHLILFRKSFEQNPVSTTRENGAGGDDVSDAKLVFQRANIERFELHRPLPCRLDLRGLSVKWWDVQRDGTTEIELTDASDWRDYKDDEVLDVFGHLLREDVHKEAGTFTAIEGALNEQGHRDKAEKVRQWLWNSRRGGQTMWERMPESEHRPRPAWLRRVWYKRLEKFGYGQAGWLLFLAGLSLLSLTTLFSEPSNIVPSLAALEAMPDLDPATAPRSEEWSPVDAGAVAFRTHVPMLSIVARDDWRPSPLVLASPFGQMGLTAVTAEDIATVISTIAWGWWALFLLSITGITRRAGLSAR